MTSSISPKPEGFILDTNVLSVFARVDQLRLLTQFSKIPLYITSSIHHELKIGFEKGVDYLEDVLHLIESGRVQSISPNESDQQFMSKLSPKLGLGEAEAIALCYRRSLVFITHDRKAANYCECIGIRVIRLMNLLERMENVGLLDASTMDKMLLR